MMTSENKSTEEMLEVRNLTKKYGNELNIFGRKFGRKVIGAKNVTFSVHKGEIFGFLGPNGAGKTTTIRSILGYLNIESGVILIDGMDHKKKNIEIRKHMVYIPGDVNLYGNFTGFELIDFFGKFRVIDSVFLDELRKNFRVDLTLKIKSLSKGNRQQVALIAALASNPDLLVLDEPTLGLDPLMVQHFHNLLKYLQKQGKTIFISSHDLTEVQQICDRVGIIKEGKMIIIEKVEDLRNKSLQNVLVDFGNNNPEMPKIEQFKEIKSIMTVDHINSNSFSIKITGDVNELLKLLSKYPVKRLTIENSSLQDIFLQFYT